MDIQTKDISGSKKEVEITLTYDEIKPKIDKALEDYRKKANIPGFRKGKVPMDMIRKMYGDSIEQVEIDNVASDAFRDYVIESNVQIVDRGRITDLDYKPGENLKFTVQYEVHPEIEVKDYKGLELNKTVYKIEDATVDEEVKYTMLRFAARELDGQAFDDEYVVTIDIQALDDDGNMIIGDVQKDIQVYLGSPQVAPEFKKGLEQIREGEERTIETKDTKGEPKKVKLTAKKIEKLVMPEANEKFFKDATGRDDISTMYDFRNMVREEIQKSYDANSKRQLENDIVSEIIKQNDIEVPEAYINNILDSMLKNYKERAGKKLPSNFDEEDFRKKNRVDAVLQAKWYLIKEKLVELENIEVGDEDYQKLADENAKMYGIPADKLIDLYKGNEELQMQLMTDKVLGFLTENAKVTEKEHVVGKDHDHHEHEHDHDHDEHDHQH